MKAINQSELLKGMIHAKQEALNLQGLELKAKYQAQLENLKPVNLVRHSFRKWFNPKELKVIVLNAGIGLTVGLISKKLMLGNSSNVVRRIFAGLIQKTGMFALRCQQCRRVKICAYRIGRLY